MAEAMLQQKIVRMRQRRTAPLILELDLTEGLTEEPPSDPVSALLTMRRARLADVLEGLRRARSDDRVRALVVKLGGRPIGLARVQELRAAVQEFARAGKTTVAWAETFGESSPGNVPYYLATAFDRIYLQPSGELELTGISIQQLFFRDALDKLGLDYQVAKRQEYKSAADRFTERGFTGPAREAMQRLAVSITQQLTDAIAERLKIGDSEARALIDRGPFLAS
jgi:protease-4